MSSAETEQLFPEAELRTDIPAVSAPHRLWTSLLTVSEWTLPGLSSPSGAFRAETMQGHLSPLRSQLSLLQTLAWMKPAQQHVGFQRRLQSDGSPLP